MTDLICDVRFTPKADIPPLIFKTSKGRFLPISSPKRARLRYVNAIPARGLKHSSTYPPTQGIDRRNF